MDVDCVAMKWRTIRNDDLEVIGVLHTDQFMYI